MTGQAMIAGMRGDDTDAERLAQQAEALVLPARISAVLCGIQFARGVTAIAAGRYDEAFDQLRRVFDRADPCLPGRCRAPGRSATSRRPPRRQGGRRRPARSLAAFQPAELDSVAPWTRVALIYAAPLLAEDDAAEAEFRRALAANLVRWPALPGAPAARVRFVAAPPVPGRAGAGDHCGPHGRCARRMACFPGPSAPAGSCAPPARPARNARRRQRISLSPQELQIAQLAAGGLSNREIGRAAVPVAPDRRLPPLPDLPEAGHHLTHPAAVRAGHRRRQPGCRIRPVQGRPVRGPCH